MTKQEAEALVDELLAQHSVVIRTPINKRREEYRKLREELRDRIIAALCSRPDKEETDADTENA